MFDLRICGMLPRMANMDPQDEPFVNPEPGDVDDIALNDPVGGPEADDAIDLSEPEPREETSVEQDTICRSCGYNLRGLSLDTTCPECGQAVAESIGSDRLRFAEPAWLTRMIRGATMYNWSTVGVVLCMLLTMPIQYFFRQANDVTQIIVWVSLMIVLITVLGFWVMSVWLITGRETVPRPGQYRPALAWTARFGFSTGVITAIGFLLLEPAGINLLPRQLQTLPVIVSYSLLGIGLVTMLLHLRLICPRIPDAKLKRSTLIVAIGMGLCCLLYDLAMVAIGFVYHLQFGGSASAFDFWQNVVAFGGCGALLTGLVFGILMLMVIDRYRRACTTALKQQRRQQRDRR